MRGQKGTHCNTTDIGRFEKWGRGACTRAYNGISGKAPAGYRDRAPGNGVRGKPLKLKDF